MSIMKRFIDIGANLTDAMYRGIYHDSQKHPDDLENVLKRSWEAGLEKIIITGGNLEDSEKALQLAKSDGRLFSTVGCHPTRCQDFESKGDTDYLEQLKLIIEKGKDKVVAIGECGLDYDRLQFCPKDIQKKYFEKQLELTEIYNLPLFLHCRNAAEDLYNILRNYKCQGVVHSFDGTPDEAKLFLELGYYIGLNGCSLKTKENLDTVLTIPTDKILLETDCPWCEIKLTHASYPLIPENNRISNAVREKKWKPDYTVKGRNEPSNIRQVLDVIAAVKQEDSDTLSSIIYDNTVKLFFKNCQ